MLSLADGRRQLVAGSFCRCHVPLLGWKLRSRTSVAAAPPVLRPPQPSSLKASGAADRHPRGISVPGFSQRLRGPDVTRDLLLEGFGLALASLSLGVLLLCRVVLGCNCSLKRHLDRLRSFSVLGGQCRAGPALSGRGGDCGG